MVDIQLEGSGKMIVNANTRTRQPQPVQASRMLTEVNEKLAETSPLHMWQRQNARDIEV